LCKAKSVSRVGKSRCESVICEITPYCFEGRRRVGGRRHDSAEVGGWVFLAEALDRRLAVAVEVGGEDGDQLARERLAQMRGFDGHCWLSGTKKPGRFRGPGGFPRLGWIGAEYRRKRRTKQPVKQSHLFCHNLRLVISLDRVMILTYILRLLNQGDEPHAAVRTLAVPHPIR
jgi:hypothetical protein